ncbi:MAG: beta-galactosidase [Defluviitaleaceae bacterium]|nr:beta-galactosidase [Defluviitaleaceae bacterium]
MEKKLLFKDYPHLLHGGDYCPEQWLSYPEILEEDIRLFKLAKINSVTMGMFAWGVLEPAEGQYNFDWLDERMDRMAKEGIKVVLGTPSGARPAWLDLKYPEVCRVAENRVRNLRGGRHNHCFTSPVYREKVTAINNQLAQRYAKHPALLLWHLSNEYSGECHCELCQEAFRNWLRKRYNNDIEALNHAWWTRFWSRGFTSFDQVVSPAHHGENVVHGLNIDWKRFSSYQTDDFIQMEIDSLRKYNPNISITTNNMGTFPGLDLWKQTEKLDLACWDSYPHYNVASDDPREVVALHAFTHDLNRSLKQGKPFLLMESTPSQTNWAPVNGLKPPGVHQLLSMQAVAHGSDSVQYFQLRKSRGSFEKYHGAVIDHCGTPDTRVFKEVAEVGSFLQKLDAAGLAGCTIKAEVAVLYDWENLWAIEEFAGFNNDRSRRAYRDTCVAHYRAFWENGLSCDIVGEDSDFSGYKILAMPMLHMLRPGVAARLKDFVKNGGTLITTYLSGYVNESDLCFIEKMPGDGLGEVMGIWTEELDALYDGTERSLNFKGKEYKVRDFAEIVHPASNTEVVGTYISGFYEGQAAVTRHSFGNGAAYHIAAKTDLDFLKAFYTEVQYEAKITPLINLKEVPAGVSITCRGDEEKRFIFLMNFSEVVHQLMLTDKSSYVDVLAGSKVEGTFTLPSHGFLVLKQA